MTLGRPSPHDLVALGEDALPTLRDRGLAVPGYDRALLRPRIVHIGVGGFHRSHLAAYCHELASRGSDWGIRGIGLLPHDAGIADALHAQDHLYALTLKAADGTSTAVIGSIVDFRMAGDDAEPAVDAIADPETAIVSMTVTEAGYADNEGNRRTFDVIAAGLERRRRLGLGPVTVLSCDNLPGNGDMARRRVVAAAARIDADCAAWVDAQCTFPNSMVDRITPTTADADREFLAATYGLIDRWPVVAEPFRQWAVEDRFAAGRPAFEDVGVLFTDDVHAWELYKLRLLNAGHTAIAYLGALAGITYVDEAVTDAAVGPFLSRLLLDEAVPTLTPIPGHPPQEYVATVLARFANTGVRDQIARLCVDGASKFATFLMPTIEANVARGGPLDMSALALAGWAHYLADTPVAAQARDDHGEPSRQLAAAARDEPTAFLDGNDVVPNAVARDTRFRAAFETAHRRVTEIGPSRAIAVTLDG